MPRGAYRPIVTEEHLRLEESIVTKRAFSIEVSLVALATTIVLAWRSAAFLRPSSWVSIAAPLRAPLGLLGIGFLACGLFLWVRRRDHTARAFLRYCLGGAVHWGGLPGSTIDGVALFVLLLYVAATTFGGGALLELTLRIRRATARKKGNQFPIWPVYLPAAVALAMSPIASMLPRPVLEVAAAGLLGAGSIMALIAVLLLLASWLRWDEAQRRAQRLGFALAITFVAGVVAGIGSSGVLGVASDAWNLILVATPIAFANALWVRPHGSVG
jgi:hypothetical protein